MPPVTMTGVSAMARSPSSTLSRVISKKFPVVAKFGAMTAKSTTSAASAASRIASPVRRRCQSDVMTRRYARAAPIVTA